LVPKRIKRQRPRRCLSIIDALVASKWLENNQ